ncbi:MAG: hypothetical protein DBX36_00035 [Oscillospiraceae bacterium]|nr:MAG: hypothetical protein DBX36_00035 [Oscillospiraceae bacterium]
MEFFLKNKKYLYFCIKYAIIQVRRYRIYLAVLVCTDLSGCSVYVLRSHKYQEMLSSLSQQICRRFFCLAGKIAFSFSTGVFLSRRKDRIQIFCRRFLRSVGKLFFKQLFGIFCKNQQKKFKLCGKLA